MSHGTEAEPEGWRGSHPGLEARDLMNELSVRSATRADGNWVLAGRDFGNKE